MTLLEIARGAGLDPKYAASTNGGEYKSACPKCGGKDRLWMHPNAQSANCVGKYWCRGCGMGGDTIKFLKEVYGMEFKQAAEYIGVVLTDISYNYGKKSSVNRFKASPVITSSEIWKRRCFSSVKSCHTALMGNDLPLNHPDAILENKEEKTKLNKRGITDDTIKEFKIGWHSKSEWPKREDWGLHNPNNKKLWIPEGIFIPTYSGDARESNLERIKVRRDNLRQDDQYGKYIALSGSSSGLSIIGNQDNNVVIVVESELDAYALYSHVGDYAIIISVGSNIKDPDTRSDYLAGTRELLICHDNDKAGQAMMDKWKRIYSHAVSYPMPVEAGKDVGEAFKNGFDVSGYIRKHKTLGRIKNKALDVFTDYVNEYATEATEGSTV